MIVVRPNENNNGRLGRWTIGASEDSDSAVVIPTSFALADQARVVVTITPLHPAAQISCWRWTGYVNVSGAPVFALEFQKDTDTGSGVNADAGPPAQIEVAAFLVPE